MSETRCSCGDGCATFGECMRRKGLRIGFCRSAAGLDYSTHKAWHRELDFYKDARTQGVQPAGTRTHQIRAALDASDRSGQAYDASKDVV